MTLVNYSALTRPVTTDEVNRFRQWARSTGWIDTVRARVSKGQIVFLVLFELFFLVVFGNVFTSIATGLTEGVVPAAVVSVAVPVVLLALAVGLAVTVWRSWNGTPKTWEKHLRLREFAAARGATYTGLLPAPAYPGMIFDVGTLRAAFDSVRVDSGRPLEVANYRYTIKQGKSSTTYRWGYVALKLDRRLPHMVLDAASNNLMFGSNLPRRFDKDSILSLEGDFDRYFTLYVPPEYERDALYVFTPDLMALLIDESSAFDVEIVDDWLFLYSTKPFDLLLPAVWQRLDRIVETVGFKALSQTDRYADDRVIDKTLNVVAPEGRRMKRSLKPVAILTGVVTLAFIVFNFWQVAR